MRYLESESRIPGAVLWRTSSSGTVSVPPDGCMDIISVDGRLVIAGSDTRVARVATAGLTRYAGLRFAPGLLPTLLPLSARDLLDTRVPLEEVLPTRAAQRLQERIGEGACFESAVSGFLRRVDPPGLAGRRRLIEVIARAAERGGSVASIARATGFSERQLHRVCVDSFGYGLAMLRRVRRFQRASAAIATGVPLAEVASWCGYADQSHMTREFAALAGRRPSELRPRLRTGGA